MPDSKKTPIMIQGIFVEMYICSSIRGNLGSGTVELKFRTSKNLAVYGA